MNCVRAKSVVGCFAARSVDVLGTVIDLHSCPGTDFVSYVVPVPLRVHCWANKVRRRANLKTKGQIEFRTLFMRARWGIIRRRVFIDCLDFIRRHVYKSMTI